LVSEAKSYIVSVALVAAHVPGLYGAAVLSPA
jgi:hypothetical protein